MTMARDFSQLPEDILSYAISLATPRDACVASAVSRAFRSAANSDTTWKHFLPPDCTRFLSEAVKPMKNYTSNKKLYFRLCDRPVLIRRGSMSFGLDRSTGAKIFMIASSYLKLSLDFLMLARWRKNLSSRFRRCAVLKGMGDLCISGGIKYDMLTPNTLYAGYLVFKLKPDEQGFGMPFQMSAITVDGPAKSQHIYTVCLNPAAVAGDIPSDVIRPRQRQDGWLEVELGEFNTADGFYDGLVKMHFGLSCDFNWDYELILEGIEIKPRY